MQGRGRVLSAHLGPYSLHLCHALVPGNARQVGGDGVLALNGIDV